MYTKCVQTEKCVKNGLLLFTHSKLFHTFKTLQCGTNAILVTERKWCNGISMLANVNIRLLANVLLAVVAHSNQALTLHCAFSFCVMKCLPHCLYPLFAISCKTEEDVAVEEELFLKIN